MKYHSPTLGGVFVTLALVGAMATTGGSTHVAALQDSVPPDIVRQPLTGVPVDDAADLIERPALVVAFDNYSTTQPQAGLDQADIVYELIVEGGITRLLAVFNSTDSDPVGPIRSGRTQDIPLLSSYDAPIFAHSGGNQGVLAALARTDWIVLSQGDGMFRDDQYFSVPHNLYANTTELYALGGAARDATPQFTYVEPGGEIDGPLVTTIDVRVGEYDVGWAWDASHGLFLRSQDGQPHELIDGQVSANTVIVIPVPYRDTPVHAMTPEAETIGSGEVFVYSGGRAVVGTWRRVDETEPFTLEANGVPITIVAGRTWVEFANVDDYEITDDAPAT